MASAPHPERTHKACVKCKQHLGPGGRQAHCDSHTCPWCAVCAKARD